MKRWAAVAVSLGFLLSPLLPAAPAEAHLFRFRAPPGTRTVAVAGTFNNWSATATPMADADGDEVWTADVPLEPGAYHYKFVVNGGEWKVDPENPLREHDGLGGDNSALRIGAGGEVEAAEAASPEPAHVFSYRAPAGVRSVVVAGDFNGWSLTAAPMSDADGDGVWEASVDLPTGIHKYKFVVNGTDWRPDPRCTEPADDWGNSVIRIGIAAAVTAPAGDAAAAVDRSVVPEAFAADSAPGAIPVTLTLRFPEARTVHLAGAFNRWLANTGGMVTGQEMWMLRKAGDETWTITLLCRPGKYEIIYVVDGGARWIPDPSLPSVGNEGHSLLRVEPPPDPALLALPSADHLFRFQAPAGAERIAVAGTFNDWNPHAVPLADTDGDGVWTATAPLRKGMYLYRFVVNSVDWCPDPENPFTSEDENGIENSILSVLEEALRAGPHVFRFRPPMGARDVSVAGSFNGWSATATRMTDADGDGVWTAEASLPAGTQAYKFVVDGDWRLDLENPHRAPDGMGGSNSILFVEAGPGGDAHLFRLRAPSGTRTVAVAGTFNAWSRTANALSDADGDGVWEARVPLPDGESRYQFVLDDATWTSDPENPDKVDDGYGGMHSVVRR